MPMPPNATPPAMPTGQPPTGSSPATSPVPNKGLEAAGMAKLGLVIRQLETIVPLLGAGTEAGRDVLKALTNLSKHVPPGAVSPGVEKSSMDQMALKMKQQTPQLEQMRAALMNKAGGEVPSGGAEPPAAAA